MNDEKQIDVNWSIDAQSFRTERNIGAALDEHLKECIIPPQIVPDVIPDFEQLPDGPEKTKRILAADEILNEFRKKIGHPNLNKETDDAKQMHKFLKICDETWIGKDNGFSDICRQQREEHTANIKADGFFIFYYDTTMFINSEVERFKEIITKKLPAGITPFFIPNTDRTHMEYIKF